MSFEAQSHLELNEGQSAKKFQVSGDGQSSYLSKKNYKTLDTDSCWFIFHILIAVWCFQELKYRNSAYIDRWNWYWLVACVYLEFKFFYDFSQVFASHNVMGAQAWRQQRKNSSLASDLLSISWYQFVYHTRSGTHFHTIDSTTQQPVSRRESHRDGIVSHQTNYMDCTGISRGINRSKLRQNYRLLADTR